MTSRTLMQASTATCLLLLALSATAATASVTVTNRDTKDHQLTIIEDNGTKTSEQTLKPEQTLDSICPKGCVIRLNGKAEDEYELEPNDRVSIEEGYLYYDDPAPNEPASGGTTPPPAEPKKP
ncbi:MAG: hypothetical protein R3D67_00120 [Hyphomicrobiaceae bacterium]